MIWLKNLRIVRYRTFQLRSLDKLSKRGTQLVEKKEKEVVQDVEDKMAEAILYAFPPLNQKIVPGGASAASSIKSQYDKIRAEAERDL